MGIAMSLWGKAGLPGVVSIATDQAYNKYFLKVEKIDDFHLAFISFCNELNTILPGKHYKAPSQKEVENFFNDWKDKDADAKKEELIEFMKKNVTEHKPNEKAMMLTGVAAPAAAIYLKKTGESMPQLKKFRLHLVPNFVFVPSCTLLALAGARVLQLKSTAKP